MKIYASIFQFLLGSLLRFLRRKRVGMRPTPLQSSSHPLQLERAGVRSFRFNLPVPSPSEKTCPENREVGMRQTPLKSSSSFSLGESLSRKSGGRDEVQFTTIFQILLCSLLRFLRRRKPDPKIRRLG
jgi:hypothetical protein